MRDCLEYLTLVKIFHWRNNAGTMFSHDANGKSHMVRLGATGSPDIFAVKPVADVNGNVFGQIIGIECKSTYGKQSDSQIIWQREFENHGGIYFVVHSLEELMKEI